MSSQRKIVKIGFNIVCVHYLRSMALLEYLEKTGVRLFHIKLLVICFTVYGLAAMNIMLISVALPVIKSDWKLDPLVTGIILASGFLGMFIGAVMSGYLSDVIGRKKTLIIMVTISSLFTAMNALALDPATLSLLRILAGVGLGGTLILPGVYLAEYIPSEYRGRFVGLTETAWVWGVLAGILAGYFIIPAYGWRLTFCIALAPLALLPFIVKHLPESIRYLLEKKNIPELKKVLKNLGLPVNNLKYIEIKYVKLTFIKALQELFSVKYWHRTLLLWILWSSLIYTYYGIFLWLPSIYYSKLGFKIVKTLEWTLIVTLAQIPGYYSAVLLLDKIGRKPLLSTYLIIAGLACLVMSTAHDINSILLSSIVISFFNLGAWSILYAYTPELYPTRVRGTGAGAASSVGRIAGILAPAVTGYLMAIAGEELVWAFAVFALVHWIAGFAVILLGEETKGKMLEEIAE